MPDDWLENSSQTNDTSYALDKFYTASTNKRGFRSTLRANVAPELAGHLGEIVASRVFPDYKTSGDIIRDALVHRVQWLVDHSTDPAIALRTQTLLDRLRAEAELDALTMLAEYEKRMADKAMNLLRYIHEGNREETLAKVRALIPIITDPHIREQLSREVDK